MPPTYRPCDSCVDTDSFGRRATAEFWTSTPVTPNGYTDLTTALAHTPHLLAAITQHRLVYEIRLAMFKIDMRQDTYTERARYSVHPGNNRVRQLFGGKLLIKLDDIDIAYTILGDLLPPIDPRGWATEMTYRHQPPDTDRDLTSRA
ncbi:MULTISPECIES: hypothetical protein [unclassified Gordonia (in: high G+C Gram-positive bacteria)]|uniref:hypothetical protein n=1 Tax=Gordonia sp. B7-2 TaxID=3420932 RepID=UPI003D8FE819